MAFFVWDVEGKKYFDFLSAYSAVNKVIATRLIKAPQNNLYSALTSRAFITTSLANDRIYDTILWIRTYVANELGAED
jgi:acetylornithine/succinyldiaminopimelate/putrescine aminotransferase